MSFDRYFDEHGMLCMADRDGGDTATKTGLYRFGRWFKFRKNKEQLVREQAKFNQELDGLECPDRKGWYVRHPAPGEKYLNVKWWSDPRTFSRDQQRSIVMAMGALKLKGRLFRITWEHIKRGGFYQNTHKLDGTKKPAFNTDIAAPNHVGEYIRAFWMAGIYPVVLLYPLLILGDIASLIGLALNYETWKQNPDEADDDNLIMSTLQAKVALPTPFSYIARKWYVANRPVAGYIDEEKTITLRGTTDMTGPESAMAWKHRPATGAPPFYEELYKDIMKEHMR